MDKTELFEKAPVHKAVINMAVPTINDQEVIDYGTHMLVALQLAGPILGLVLRQGIFLIPLIFALNHFFGLSGVVYSNPVADYLAVVVSYIVCIQYMRQMGESRTSE